MAAAVDAELLEALPAVLAEIAEATSVETALLLATKFGGTQVRFSARPRPDNPVARHIGDRDYAKLQERFGSGYVLIPLGPARRDARQGRAIHQMIEKGFSNAEIARSLGCHERTVRRHRSGETDARQLDLFALPE